MNKTPQIWNSTLFILSMIVCANIIYQVLYKDVLTNDSFIFNLIPAIILLILTSLTIFYNKKAK